METSSQTPIVPVILAGGSGTQLWPLSRAGYPKQFLSLDGKTSPLQQTLWRASASSLCGEPIVLCHEEHRFLVAEHLRLAGVERAEIFLEPAARGTAFAAGLAALAALERWQGDPLVLTLPVELHPTDGIFQAAIERALPAAEQGRLVTLASRFRHHGTWRLKCGAEEIAGTFNIDGVAMSPTAQEASEAGYASTGIHLFQASRYLEELSEHAPELLSVCERAYAERTSDLHFHRLPAAALEGCPVGSIELLLSCRSNAGVLVPVDGPWHGLHSWPALMETGEADNNGNVTRGDVYLEQGRGNYVHAESRLVAAVGIEDYLVVETADAVLVAPKPQAAEVEQIVARLKEEGRVEAQFHRRVFRPWGSYEGIATADRFQAKRIIVNPGATLSLQMHHHRAEHWIIVRGTAKVTCGERAFLLSEDQSTYVPLGARHRLENVGKIPLELIEVQTGSYLGEDDIVRFDDVYGRQRNGEGAG